MPQPTTRERLAALWPPSLLRARAGDLELRYLDDDLMVQLADLAGQGVHEPEAMPFLVPWTRGTPGQVARSVLVYQWRARASVTPQRWTLELAVLHRGESVGIQAIEADDFPHLRAVNTGSWLGQAHQGQGLGTRMRALVLHVAFQGFGAHTATTSAWADNPASNAVSRRLGYRPNGSSRQVREGVPTEHWHYRMDRADYRTHAAAHAELLGQVQLDGIDELREFLEMPDRGVSQPGSRQ
ncbi:MAG TPA: GNAT family N-acetyltransferase [Candidatus Ruania gallistercoris]|uniref:GNAT family N-acetyltransferase n=1 Tax=Candidatus Ruania gallistercoris TaxID=2838746 RepID=A0A9D2EEG8_9MICO|nr:GNAT family N-acetyltransferase [Candidatus Ruania gallistercoris]